MECCTIKFLVLKQTVLIPSLDGDEVELLEKVRETFFDFIEPLLRIIRHLNAHLVHSGSNLLGSSPVRYGDCFHCGFLMDF